MAAWYSSLRRGGSMPIDSIERASARLPITSIRGACGTIRRADSFRNVTVAAPAAPASSAFDKLMIVLLFRADARRVPERAPIKPGTASSCGRRPEEAAVVQPLKAAFRPGLQLRVVAAH